VQDDSFANAGLRGIFGPKRDEIAGGGKTLHNEELHNLYMSPIFSRMIESKNMRCYGT
jgi:hypothetical protein